jgi:hypothetical protein
MPINTTTPFDAREVRETTKDELVSMLDHYDDMRAELRKLERELNYACTSYGVNTGIWGFRPDHLRAQLRREKQERA